MEIRFAINGNVLIVLEARTCCVNSKAGKNNNNNNNEPRKSIVYDVNIMSAAARLRFIQNKFIECEENAEWCLIERVSERRGGETLFMNE